MKKLYKKDSTGKIRIWTVDCIGGKLVQCSGLVDGAMVEYVKVCKGKNLGKKNETTPAEQAISEMLSYYKKKLTEGYFTTKVDAEQSEVILPMLANEYKKRAHKIDWASAFIQPKLDGMRCLAFIQADGTVKLMSRYGVDIMAAHNASMLHIAKELGTLNKNVILDGELYAEGHSFQENMRLIKKYRPGETENIKFHVYDIVSNDCYANRFNSIVKLFGDRAIAYITIIVNRMINSEEDIRHHHEVFVSMGYEGSMIRSGLKGYQVDKRSDCLLKHKDHIDITATLIDVIPNDANPLHGTPVFEGFKAGVKGNHKFRMDLLANKHMYIGQTAEIRFFEYTEDGKPRFPIMHGFRLDK